MPGRDVIKLCYFPFSVAIILPRSCLWHVLPYFTKRNQRPTSHTQLKKQLLHKDVSIQRRRRPCSGSWKAHSKAYLVTLAEIQDTPAWEVARSHSSCILSFDLIGQHQNKRFYGTKIVLSLAFADAIFGRERSDDRKCVCCSQAINCPDEHKN